MISSPLFLPLGLALIAATVIGILTLPFVLAMIVAAFLVGKVAILEYLGGNLGKAAGASWLQRPLLALFLGGAIVALLYNAPVVGLLTFLFITVWGFGAAVAAFFTNWRRESPPKPVKLQVNLGTPAPPPPAGPTEPPPGVPAVTMPVGQTQMPPETGPTLRPAIDEGQPAAAVPVVLAYPRGILDAPRGRLH